MEKRCSHCGRVLPAESFYKDSKSEDGLSRQCKDCHRQASIESYRRRKANDSGSPSVENVAVITTTTTIDQNNPLAQFKPRELIAELSRRGYHGTLRYVNVIEV